MNFSSFNWASVHLCFVIKITNLFDENRKTGKHELQEIEAFYTHLLMRFYLYEVLKVQPITREYCISSRQCSE